MLRINYLIVLIFLPIVLFSGCTTPQNDLSETNQLPPLKSNSNSIKTKKIFERKDPNLLRVCHGETSPNSLDPIAFDNRIDEITFHIFDRLIMWNEKAEIIPGLAESFNRIDQKTYIFHLRKDVTFHNGEKFDANSVKFTLERILDKNTKSPGYSLFQSIENITIIDPYTIKITTNKIDYLLKEKLSLVQIIPEQTFKKLGQKAFSQSPVGTGAYEFEEMRKDGSIVLKKNPKYWDNSKPKINKLVFSFIKVNNGTNEQTKKKQLQALFNSEIDLLMELPGIQSLNVSKNPNTRVIKFPNVAKVQKMLFNSMKKPFSDIRARKAVNLSLNRDILIKVLAKGNGKKIATNSVPIEFGHNPELKPYKYDLKQAKKLLKEAGYSKELSIKIAVTEDTRLIAQAIKKDLEKININADYHVMTVSEMAQGLSEYKLYKTTPKWEYDIAIYSGVDPFLHVGFLYGLSLYSKGPFSTTENKIVDETYEELIVTLDEAKQRELCYKLEELSYNNYWYTPVYQVVDTLGAAKDLVINESVTSFVDLATAYYK